MYIKFLYFLKKCKKSENVQMHNHTKKYKSESENKNEKLD